MKSIGSWITRGVLLTSGLIATGIAAMILFAPDAFYAGYDLDIGGNVSLANEMKAPAGALLLAGLLVTAGAFRPAYTIVSLATAAGVYLSYGLARLSSMAIDGMPHGGLVSAAVIEVAIGTICLADLLRHRRPAVADQSGRGNWHAQAGEDAA